MCSQRLKSVPLLPPRDQFVSTTTSRYMEATKPVRHPTAQDMAIPQIEQTLELAGNARRRLFLSSGYKDAVAGHGSGRFKDEGGIFEAGMMSLALAWEGTALTMLATRGRQIRRYAMHWSLYH